MITHKTVIGRTYAFCEEEQELRPGAGNRKHPVRLLLPGIKSPRFALVTMRA